MPLIIPQDLPAYEMLGRENIFVMHRERASGQDIRPLEILILNLMPTKTATETQLARLLANTPLQVNFTLLKTASYDSKNTSREHLDAFYRTFEDIKEQCFDGMIITGAPVEHLEFEDVDYWDELTQIMDYSRTHVYSTMHVCWGAQAGLYYHYGINKKPLENKMFGIFEHRVLDPCVPLVRGFDEVFAAPHSRHTDIDENAVAKCSDVKVLAQSDEAGIYLLKTDNGRQIFVTGHPEYDLYTLDAEYRRDLAAGREISAPQHYYQDDDPSNLPVFRWRAHAHLLYSNWLNYYVYQDTPYCLANLPEL